MSAPARTFHVPLKSASFAFDNVRRSSATFSSNSRKRTSVGSKLYPGPAARSRSIPFTMSDITFGILQTSWVRCPRADDFGCGFPASLITWYALDQTAARLHLALDFLQEH